MTDVTCMISVEAGTCRHGGPLVEADDVQDAQALPIYTIGLGPSTLVYAVHDRKASSCGTSSVHRFKDRCILSPAVH